MATVETQISYPVTLNKVCSHLALFHTIPRFNSPKKVKAFENMVELDLLQSELNSPQPAPCQWMDEKLKTKNNRTPPWVMSCIKFHGPRSNIF